MNKTTALHLMDAAFLLAGSAVQAGPENNRELLLGELLRVAEIQTGVVFQLDPCLSADSAPRTVAEVSAPGGVENLLEGYNYGAVRDARGRLVRVIVSGRIADPDPVCSAAKPASDERNSPSMPAPHPELLRYEPLPPVVPDRYHGRAPGSVTPVSLPIDELVRMEPGNRLELSLPDGRFGVILESRFRHDNGDVTWVGYLEGADPSDGVIITTGSRGSVGQVITPGSSYVLEFEEGRSWLVDTGPGLWPAMAE